jgi:hypothetical protein
VHGVGNPLRESLRQLLHLVLHVLLEFESVRARHLIDGEDDRRILAEERGRSVLQRAELDARHVAQPDHGSGGGIGAHDDFPELGRVTQPPDRVDLHLEGCSRRRRRLADLARRDLDVLLRNRVLDVDRRDAEIGEFVGIEPDAHRIAPLAEDLDVADAGKPLQGIDDLQIGVVAERDRVDGPVRRGQIDDEDEVRILLLDRDAGLIDDGRQRGSSLRHAVLNVDRGNAERIADIEGDRDVGRAVVRARRRHVCHALDAVDLLLKRGRHRIGNDLSTRARIDRAHDHLRRGDVRKLRHRQEEIANGAGEHHDDGDRRRKDRTFDEEVDHDLLYSRRPCTMSVAAPCPARLPSLWSSRTGT